MSKKPKFEAESTHHLNLRAWVHELKGKFMGLPECYDFLEDARDNISEETPHVILLMQGVTLLNSTGIGMIAALLTSAQKRGGKLSLVGLTDLTRRQLEVTHLLEFVTLADDLGQAGEAMA